MSAPSTDTRIFVPRPSSAWRGLLAPAILFLIALVGLLLFAGVLPLALVLPLGIATFLLSILMFGLAFLMRRATMTMHYELSRDKLLLVGSPVRYEVPLQSIRRIHTQNIDRSYRNRVKSQAILINTSDLAVGNVAYKDLGMLKMCATSSWQQVIIIETAENKYGITPANAAGFLDAMRNAGVPVEN